MEGDVEQLNAHLQSLKRHGANVLVLTDPSDLTVCTQLLGTDSIVRRRLHVRTHGDVEVDPVPDPTRFGLIEVPGGETRTAICDSLDGTDFPTGAHAVEPQTPDRPTPSSTPESAPEWFSRPEPDSSLSTLARHIHEHLTRFEAAEPAPGEVRVCFDSLDTFVDSVDYPRLYRFLHVVTGRVRSARAIGHYHLATSVSQNTRDDFVSLFDATVETRPAPGGLQQRWTLHEKGIQTDWLRVG